MKGKALTVAVVCTLAGSMLMPSCIGSFTLTNKLLAWNKQISNKFINELVFFAFWVLPVYEVSGLADVLVLNSIEFWSGENPLASGSKVIEGNDGRYLVSNDAMGYTVKSLTDGTEVRLNYNCDDNSWGIVMPDGSEMTIFSFVDDSHIALPVNGGDNTMTVELSDAGLLAYSSVASANNFAMR